MMNRKFSFIAAGLALLFFVSTLAEAVDFKFSGQIRPRYNLSDHKGVSGFESDIPPEQAWTTRVRFAAKIILDENNSGFIQFQATSVWGDINDTSTGSRNAFFGSDSVFDVGLHQAYFTAKNLYGSPIDLQIGRQELILDGHRLVGNVGWTQGGRSHDGARITFSQGDATLLYFYSKSTEFDIASVGNPIATADDPSDELDINGHILWGNYKGLIGDNSSTSLYFIYIDRGNTNPDIAGPPVVQGLEVDNDIYTVGMRQAGNLFGIDYRGEFYYQFGDAENYTFSGVNPLGYSDYINPNGAGSGIDRHAYMFGVRVGKRFAGIPWKPSITAWYDHVSGTDQDDINDQTFSTFNTLYATQHKYYGHMDLYLLGRFSTFGTLLGLRDLAVKTSIQPHKKLLLKADWHWFWTDTDLSDPANAPLAGFVGCACGPNQGQELDITFVHRYNQWLTFSMGYSHYFSTRLFKNINPNVANSANSDDADWAFAQFDWRF